MTESRVAPFVRTRLVLAVIAMVFGTFYLAGPRSAFVLLVGLGFGLVLEGFRFGFAGPWRLAVKERDGRGLLAQFLAIGLTAAVALPLLASHPEELAGAVAPIGPAMLGGAFVFGIAMQLVMGCGSGTLVNAGSGNLVGLVALAGFIAGSFIGTLHLGWWSGLGTLPLVTMQSLFGAAGGLWLTLLGLALLAAVTLAWSEPGKRKPPPRLLIAGFLLALLAILNLVIAGQAWGVVYGLGLWGAKLAQLGGLDVAGTAYWSNPVHAKHLQQSLLTDVTSLTNIGLMCGAFLAVGWRRRVDPQVANLQPVSWLVVIVAGLVLGYSSRIAFGCNVGAYFSGISTGSLHGWAWFAAALAGTTLGVKLRPILLQQRSPRLEVGIP